MARERIQCRKESNGEQVSPDAYHGREHTLHDSTENVEDIAHQPYDDELEREAVCIAASEILEDLGRKDDNPASYGDGPVESELWGSGSSRRMKGWSMKRYSYPQIPEMASTSRGKIPVGGAIE